MLDKIDDYLFYARFGFQNISDECKKLTGLTNFGIAKWAYIVAVITTAFLAIMLSIATVYITGGYFSFYSLSYWLCVVYIIVMLAKDIIDLEKKDTELRQDGGCIINSRRIDGKKARISSIRMASFFVPLFTLFWFIANNILMEVIVFTFIVLQITFVSALYFGDCTPLPPSGKSKIKKWYQKTIARIKKRMFEKEDLSGPQFWQ